MMVLLRFIFQDAWHFLGIWLLIVTLFVGAAVIIEEIKRPRASDFSGLAKK